MNSNIFIPKKINVGFQKRSDTYTQKLAYVIYFDQKGVLRKETSWNGWRDKDIENIIYDNVPTSGFVLNKKVGDYICDWNHRQAYVRVYDPRDFEFEITIENLLYILENASSIKGKGLEGEFTYGWDGKDLILIPVESPDYQQLTNFNDIVHNNSFIKAKELIIGATYLTKENTQLVYMGKFDCYKNGYRVLIDGQYSWYEKHSQIPQEETSDWRGNNRYNRRAYEYLQHIFGKQFFFAYKDGKNNKWSFMHYKSISQKFIAVQDSNCTSEYANIFDELECCEYYSPVDKSEYISYSLEEFIEKHSNENRGFYILKKAQKRVSSDREYDTIYVYKQDDGTYYGNSYNEKENYSLEQLFEKYNPVYCNIYMANGKLKERNY